MVSFLGELNRLEGSTGCTAYMSRFSAGISLRLNQRDGNTAKVHFAGFNSAETLFSSCMALMEEAMSFATLSTFSFLNFFSCGRLIVLVTTTSSIFECSSFLTQSPAKTGCAQAT